MNKKQLEEKIAKDFKQFKRIKLVKEIDFDSVPWTAISELNICVDTKDLIKYIVNLKLSYERERIVMVLISPLGRTYKGEENLIALKKLREQLADKIIGDDNK